MEVEEISSSDPNSLKNGLIGQDSVAQDIVDGLLDIIDNVTRDKSGDATNGDSNTPLVEDVAMADAEKDAVVPETNGDLIENGEEKMVEDSSNDSLAINGNTTSKEVSAEPSRAASPEPLRAASSSSDCVLNGSSSVITVSSESASDLENSNKDEKDVVEPMDESTSTSKPKSPDEEDAPSSNDKECSVDDDEDVFLESAAPGATSEPALKANNHDDVSSDSGYKNGNGADENSQEAFVDKASASKLQTPSPSSDDECSIVEASDNKTSSPKPQSLTPAFSNDAPSTSSRLPTSDLSATISQLAARVSRGDEAGTSGRDKDRGVHVADVSIDDDDDDEEEEEEEENENRMSSSQAPKEETADDASSKSRDVVVNGIDNDRRSASPPAGSTSSPAPTPVMLSSSLTGVTRPCLTKGQINAIIEQRFQSYVKNLCKTDELETRFTSLEEWTENLRKKHREQV